MPITLRISKLHVHTFLICSLVSGYGITHKVSNLLIQFHGNFAPSKLCHQRADKRKRRSFFTSETLDVVISSFGKRARPGILRYPQHEDRQMLFADREQDNFFGFFSGGSLWQNKLYQAGPVSTSLLMKGFQA